ncbi:MAG TPA: flagellar biosynthetic protein FliR [Burkholderiales bacterium]|nr:flagellar biosynthetic protein FliR [Burkholderiales bacterium]
MSLTLDTGWLVVVFLISLRLGALFVLAPGLGAIQAPGPFRVFLVVALAAALVPLVQIPASAQAIAGSPGALLSSALNELVVGALLAFGLFAAFGAFMIAGRAIDVQIGFGVASLLDPVSRTHGPLLGTALNLAGLAVFLAADGHHLLLRGLALSFERVPPGGGLPGFDLGAIAAQFGVAFSLGLAIAAPVLALLLMIDLGLSVMSRTMPQWNVFFVSMPAKIFAGLAVLALSIPHLGPVMNRLFASVFRFWDQVLP